MLSASRAPGMRRLRPVSLAAAAVLAAFTIGAAPTTAAFAQASAPVHGSVQQGPALPTAPTGDEQVSEKLVFDEGHVDAFNVFYRDGALHLNLKEDVTGSHVHHEPTDVELHVKSSSLMSIPEGWPGAGDNYYLPQVQDHSLLWPGWDTLGVLDGKDEGVSEQVKLEFTKVEGPGGVHVFATGWAGWEPMLEGDATELTAGAVRDQSFAAHTHANWVFEEKGVYTISLRAVGEQNGTQLVTEEKTYTITVGDEFKGKAYEVSEPEPEEPTDPEQPEEPTDPEPSDPEQPEDPADPEQPEPTDPEPTDPEPQEPAPSDPEPSEPEQKDPQHKDPEQKAPAPVKPAPQQPAPAAGGSTDSGPQTPAAPAEPVCHPTEQTRKATDEEVTAALAGLGTPGQPGSTSTERSTKGSTVIPKSTHSHPNWVFTAPGTYRLTIRQTVTTNDGSRLSDTSTLTFDVGPNAKGVSSGHFDFGARLEGGKLVSSLKDDRTSPATWVAPSSVTFAVDDAGKAKAPAGLEFVAPAGSDVWMIGAAQVGGVPWLGANSMHDTIVNGTSGEISMQLVGAEGPGNVGVFTSGNFGQLVGSTWFTSTVSTSKTEAKKPVDAKLSDIKTTERTAKVGEVFVEDGTAMVKELVGRTDSGEDCVLPAGAGGKGAMTAANSAKTGGGLARTGADVALPAAAAVGLLLVGGALTLLDRKSVV